MRKRVGMIELGARVASSSTKDIQDIHPCMNRFSLRLSNSSRSDVMCALGPRACVLVLCCAKPVENGHPICRWFTSRSMAQSIELMFFTADSPRIVAVI